MTSQINYASINENFPVAGQDNDTQVFRDNFDTIKTSLRLASGEITELQNKTKGLTLDEVDGGSDFNNSVIYNAVLQYNIERRSTPTPVSVTPLTIDFKNGHYQVYTFEASVNVDFLNFPTNTNPALTPGVGKVTLELYANAGPHTITFVSTAGITFKKNTNPAWSSNSLTITSSTDPIILEIWQHDTHNIFLNYIGQFS